MSLKSYKPVTDTVELPGGHQLAVRGLTTNDLSALFSRYAGDIESVFRLLVDGKSKGSIAVDDASATVAQFINAAPAIAASVIACGAGDGDDAAAFEVALELPFPCQLDALLKIGKLTFGTEQSLKKFVATVSTMINKVEEQPLGS